MSVYLIVLAAGILCGGGLVCLISSRRGNLSNRLGVVVSVLGGLPAALGAGLALGTGRVENLRVAWDIPFGSFYLAVDNLSAFFVLAIAVICPLSAVYGGGYLKAYLGRKNLGASWFFYNVLFASMLLVVTARNGVLFLVAWEIMSLASFFLVVFEHEKKEVRQAGWTYLVATHLGTAFLLAMFVLLGWGKTTWDFDQFSVPTSGQTAGVIFLLAVVGFGTKAGFLPMHVWLPEAHPAAPSHVSAVMSGVMIKTGIYGLLRMVTFLGDVQSWWGWTFVGIGAASGLIGVLMALAQHDLKRLLAYHSVENIGIICLGLGLGLLGISEGIPSLAFLGLAGGLLHVWNHAIFKSLLFLGAGAVGHATGTRDIERLGGLLRKMPFTGLTFVVGSAAISGLPPLNGFVSEWMIYVGAFSAIAGAGGVSSGVLAGLMVIVSLGMIGGLAAACFTKAFGVVFLGEPRSTHASKAHEVSPSLRVPMLVLAALCVVIGLLGPLALKIVTPVAESLLPVGLTGAENALSFPSAVLWKVSLAGSVLIVLILGLALIRRRLLAGRKVETAGTWDCGYVAPTARMQYTASSFAWPILNLFRWFLRPSVHVHRPEGLFPPKAGLETDTGDPFLRFIYRPIFLGVEWFSDRLRWIQHGRNQLYILYIALTLIILLVWKLGVGR
jgi:hydrogenase-4 component B